MTRELRGWTIASIRGVALRIHISLVFLLIYVVAIASMQFPFVARQSGVDPWLLGGSPGLWGALFAVALFVSIVLHEFGHVLVAQSMGVKVRSVTLMMLGGVSEMDRIPEQRYAEFKVSIVGPIVSLSIAAILLAIRGMSDSVGVDFFCYWLARVNIALGVFNLLPALPLDGGRALRSVLAVHQGMTRATISAARIAQGLAWGLGLLGLLSFNLLLMLIAVFVYISARSELALAVSREALGDATARELVVEVEPLSEDATLGSAVQAMIRTKARILPVLTSTGTPALLSLDLVRRIPREQWSLRRVKDAMLPVQRTLKLDDPLKPALQELASIGALPVQDDRGEIKGIVLYRDLMTWVEFHDLDRAA